MACCCVLWILVLCSSIVFKTVQSRETHVIAKKGQPTVINCTLPSFAESVTWQVLRVNGYINVSTCVPNTCTDHLSNLFKGNIAIDVYGDYTSTLLIYNVTTSDTRFKCLRNYGNLNLYLADNITLDVYEVLSTPSCRISWSSWTSQNKYVDLTCEAYNEYPRMRAKLHRKELDRYDFDQNATRCQVSEVGIETKGDYYVNCTWRIPFSSLLETNTFYVEMVAVVANKTLESSRVSSRDITAAIDLPSLNVSTRNCPVGPGVRGKYIKIGTVATCRCDLIPSEQVPGIVRWFTIDGDLVKTQDASSQYSILRFTYNASDTNQTYDCRADNPTLEYYHVVYTPKFSTSPPQSLISGMLFVTGISLAFMLA